MCMLSVFSKYVAEKSVQTEKNILVNTSALCCTTPSCFFFELKMVDGLNLKCKELTKLVQRTKHFESKFPNNLELDSSKSNTTFQRQSFAT